MVCNKVVTILKSQTINNDFRSNILLGTQATLYTKMPNVILEQSIKLAQTLNSHFFSIDYLIDENKYVFCEANSNIGFVSFYENNINIYDIVMKYIKTLK